MAKGLLTATFLLPSTINLNDPETVKTYISNAPASFHLVLLMIYALSSLVGGFIASIITIDKKMSKAIVVGGVLMGLGIFNLISLSHPVWAIVCGLFAFLPFAYLGGLLGSKISSRKK